MYVPGMLVLGRGIRLSEGTNLEWKRMDVMQSTARLWKRTHPKLRMVLSGQVHWDNWSARSHAHTDANSPRIRWVFSSGCIRTCYGTFLRSPVIWKKCNLWQCTFFRWLATSRPPLILTLDSHGLSLTSLGKILTLGLITRQENFQEQARHWHVQSIKHVTLHWQGRTAAWITPLETLILVAVGSGMYGNAE